MDESVKPQDDFLVEDSIPEGAASLESILCTEELRNRPSRPPDYKKENRALVALAGAMVDSKSNILQTFAEIILEVTQCDSSGLSLLTKEGGKRFYWPAIAGQWKPHVGGGTPRNFGPCGDVLDRNCTLLFRHFERRYPYLRPVIPAAEECLLVPFYLAGRAVGTIWAIMHTGRRNFDAEDERIMNALGQFASLAYQTAESIEDRQHQENLEELVERRTTELVEARNQAQAASRAKSAFLATVSHELRSPLNTILLLSHPDWTGSHDLAECSQDLDVIRSSAEHLLRLIDDVLDSARIEAGQVTVENALLDLHDVIHEVSDLLRMRAEQKSLDFSVEESAELPRFISADAAKLRHILINLLDNAIKYTDHGKVVLRVDSRAVDSGGRLMLTFEIADTGVGIAQQDQIRIFEPFTRVTKVAASRGTGLGLSITRQYVGVMGGSIRLESVPGRGSHFFVDLPVELAAESENVTARSSGLRIVGLTSGQPECRVLIVEDRAEDRSILRRILEQAGFHVQVAETGESGIEMFKVWRPQFIWMDRRLPGMDGVKATRCIRTMDGGPDVKIVGLSASAFVSERDEMLAAGLDDFVRKPYLPREILDCMAQHLGVRYDYAESEVKSARG
ncbi:MAG TPA: ATP-binding protein [Bryobacteraceae bacterium]|nr:ATP-binding protein [Bryobacteraceae bacterium]